MEPTKKEDDYQKDEDKKAAARRSGPPSVKPGAVSMSADQAALLDQRISEKRGEAESSKTPQELGQFDLE